MTRTTWDGQPISDEKPYGITAVVFRRTAGGPEVLMLHRAHRGSDYEGEWAWTPPAGARRPGEPVDACARRELREETGLDLSLELTSCGSPEWYVYLAEAPSDAAVVVDAEHDRYEWLAPPVAIERCLPAAAREALRAAARLVEDRA
ncbi:MAG TPA: NUDIX domain-containing protein [Acidimicrobiia bacterium]|nr:NUDIX domain-containing protein [Acidimicrobiia bacterium]